MDDLLGTNRNREQEPAARHHEAQAAAKKEELEAVQEMKQNVLEMKT